MPGGIEKMPPAMLSLCICLIRLLGRAFRMHIIFLNLHRPPLHKQVALGAQRQR